jgi:hypothetical protein
MKTALLLALPVLLTVACAATSNDDTTSGDEAVSSSAHAMGWGEHNRTTLAEGETARYTFKGRKGWVVSLVMQTLDCAPGSSTGFGCKPAWAPSLKVIDASTKEVVLDRSGNLVSGDAIGETKALPEDGAYLVLVTKAVGSLSEGGKYDLTLSPPEIDCTKASDCPSEFPKCERIGETDEDGNGKQCQ